ncbi:MAG: hypothetical protein MJ071_05775 [Oscillospiraceae bacterium]|nr:hypothetical protein [Oscillospiraceae bacterium]
MNKKISLFLSVGTMLASCAAFTIHAGASGTVEDVYAAMRRIGLPESMVQEAKNQYQTIPHDSEGMQINNTYYPYDVWADLVELYEDDIWEEVGKQFDVPGEAIKAQLSTKREITTTAPQQASRPSGTTGTTVTVVTTAPTFSEQTKKPFINMTLTEKQDYVASLPENERAEFLASLSVPDRNSIIKQMSTSSQANIANGFVSLGEQLGMHITIDQLNGNGINYSIRNESGTLIDSSSVGSSVDDTGWDTTLPFFGSLLLILGAAGGILFMPVKAEKETDAEGIS